MGSEPKASPAPAETSSNKRSEGDEPPVTYVLTVGDQKISLVEGQRVRLQGSFEDPEVMLAAEPHRTFANAGISFRYPRAFGFDASLSDPASRSWSLSGNDAKIMYFVIAGPVTVAEFAQGLTSQFGKENVETTEAETRLTLGRETLVGMSLRVTLAATPMSISVYRVPLEGPETRLLVLQNSLGATHAPSSEGQEALALLKASFALTRE